MTEAERRQLLVEWNGTRTDYPKESCIHELFEAQVKRTPDAVAVTFEDRKLTYRELNRRANQWAHYLRSLGVGPEVLVGLCVERSLEMVVGLLGVLKAGGAYVPLDPAYPRERLAFMLEDAQAPVLLTQKRLMAELPDHVCKVVCLDSDWEAIAKESGENLANGVTAENLAYVIYTSGSTGKPKGVSVSHSNVVRLFGAAQSWFHFDERDVWTLFHSYAFDFSVWELWGALLYGGRLVVVPYWVSRSPEAFYDLLCMERVTVLNQTPSAFRQLMRAEEEAEDTPKEPTLRLVIFGGEALEVQSLKPWFDRHGDQRPQLVNMYGITETTVHVTYRPVTAAADFSAGRGSLIGVPIPDLELYVLDQNQNPVPIGVPGELHVGGAGVGRGYLNQPELTAERFVPNPFGPEAGERLYRSGDLARYRPEGDIEYLGRIDHQVKIRGFRIELGEIEAVLSRHPAVRETVVLAREDEVGDRRLVAYVVPNKETASTTHALHSFLKQKHPDYMVPSAFVFLDALPLTPNGKVDRRALPAPDQSRPELENPFVAPRTPVEELLAKIWAEVLKLEKVGIHDNFFDLGGHSLLATQVVSRLHEVLHVEIPLRSIFENPTVAGLAGRIASARPVERNLRAPSHSPESSDQQYPLSFAQQRLWFLEQLEPETAIYNTPEAIRIRGPLHVEALEQSLNEIVRRHQALRTIFRVIDGQPMQVILPSLILPLPVVDLSDCTENGREDEARRLAREEAERPFDLVRGPLLRATLLRLGHEDHVLLLTMHHIVSDGWSLGVFYRELTAVYDAIAKALPSPLTELTVQYVDYAQWQRNWLQGEILESQLGYWKEQLEGVLTIELPTDRPRPAVQSFRGARQFFVLPKELTETLKALSQEQRATLFMTLLAAFKALLYRYSGQRDVAVGIPIAGRSRYEFEGLIGFFVNTLVLRTDLSGHPTFRELLNRVREVALGAYGHQDLPFEKVIEELQPERDLSRNPLFQVLFQLRNLPNQTLRLSDAKIEDFPFERNIAKFDLTLDITEGAGELRCIFDYNTYLFDASTITRMQEHFKTLLESIVAQPDCAISELPLLTATEQHRLLVGWNNTNQDHPRDKCVHHLFEEQAERTPEAVAVVFENQQLTYRELNSRANRLAHYLKRHGVGPEVLVALCVERSLEMFIGLLGVLKAEGAYVPLDPEYPEDLLKFMLDDTQTPILLTEQRFAERMPKCKAKIICVDSDRENIGRESEQNPVGRLMTNSLAYVIYTSGSTGRPKGVTVEHRQIVNYSAAILEQLNLAPGSSFAMVQPLTVDACLTVIFASQLTGGSLHVISREQSLNPSALGEYFSRRPIDFLKIAPSHLAALQASSSPDKFMPRRCLMIGGEPSRWEWAQSLQALAPDRAIINHYGPTETTVGVLTHRLQNGNPPHNYLTTPLGRPIANTQVFVLDSSLQPVPIGVTGELYIGGEGLARGYLNRPELTAEKFIPNPFSNGPGERLYKSGDLGRYLPDGNIEFLGRTDHQVKIRGFRIELGEIEAALSCHPDLREVAVLVQEDALGEKRLIAYVVPTRDRSPTIAGKRRYRLPNGMAVAQLNKNETDYMYGEIFERQAYLRHGITINDGDCIFDVGANIGLFMLFAGQICKNPKVYSFEPNPIVSAILSANALLHGHDVKTFAFGLSNESKTAAFTFFSGFSLLSGFYADPKAEKEVVKAFMMNQQKAGVSEMAELIEQADNILDQRFLPQTFSAQLRTLSSVIEQEQIECIDLLKINVEKSELDVLTGIKEGDWKKIRQIVLEVDVRENLDTILSLLKSHGYDFVVEQDVLLTNTDLCYVYAIRPSTERKLIREQNNDAHIRPLPVLKDPILSSSELRSFVSKKLPEHMVPSVFLMLEAMPLTRHGKLNRRALPVPDSFRPELAGSYVGPRNSVEETLAQFWSELLSLDRVGIHDNFFDLGGHSLLATQLISRIRNAFDVDLPVRTLFETPHIAGLAQSIETLRPEGQGSQTALISPIPSDKELPLSFTQERFWFLNQLEPNHSAYNSLQTFRLIGSLNVSALERTFNEIVRRHEVLRANFRVVDDQPVQIILEHRRFELGITNLTEHAPPQRGVEIRRLVDEEAQRPFDLSNDLMLRASLLKLAEKDHLLILGLHHIAFDHWSAAILWQELSATYEAFSTGRPSPLPELSCQYKHFAVWQKQWFRGEILEKQLSYWKRQLNGSPPLLQLPTDYPRPPLKTFSGERKAAVLPNTLTKALRTLSQTEGVTLFMILLAAFKILLHRLTGQDDIVVGSPVAGRNRTETERLVGCFLNSLVLRTDLSGNPTFRQLLARVREVVLGAFDHQELPFEKLLEELEIERDLGCTPIFQVFFNMYNFEEADLGLHGLAVKRLRMTKPVSNFDLTLYVRERHNATHLNLVYNTDLFHGRRMLEMLEQYTHLLTQIVANPDQCIASFSLITSASQKLLPNPVEPLRSDWAGAVHDRLSQQARHRPKQVAVLDPHDSWTYEELNSRSNQLAHCFLESGAQPQDIVAVYGHRGASLVWAVLGVLKAGGAFLILDPAYPIARLVECLRAARPCGFVRLEASGKLPDELESYIQESVRCHVTLPRLSAYRREHMLQNYPTADPGVRIGPADLACVSYTSGSTGEPKGILGRHGPLSHFLPWQTEKFALDSSDRFSLLAGLSHDPLQREIFTALWVGAAICIPDPDTIGTPGQLARWMARQKITFAHLTPPMGKLLTESAHPRCQLPSLRYAFFVGDKLTWTDVTSLQGLAPSVTCINYYGSTETQRAVSYYEIPPRHENTPASGVIPVGRGMPNVQLLVLNTVQERAGIGEVGEIYMRSPHLARGYLNDESLTQERFLPNPFREEAADRLYRTGDTGRYLPDGNVEILGRTDRQVKIRGFRIELGEIEAALAGHSDIREAVVLARQDKPGERYLAAYVVPKSGKRPKIHELHKYLRNRLPDYMMPTGLLTLDTFPLTPNGKIDTEALPVPNETSDERRVTSVPPRTSVEEALARIWAEVLSTDNVGVRHNFFELGGHSLLAIRVMSRISQTFQVALPLRTLFEKPTIEELAAVITERQAEGAGQEHLARMMIELEALSDEEAERLLAGKGTPQIIGDIHE